MVLPADIKAALLAALTDQDLRTQVRELLGIEEREREIKQLKETVEAQTVKIKDQERRLSEIEQYSRKNVLNFTGIPEEKDENCLQLALDLGKAMGVKLDRTDIDNAHRVGRPPVAPGGAGVPAPRAPAVNAGADGSAGPGGSAGAAATQPRPLVVKCTTYVKREMVWWNRKELKKAKPPRSSTLPEDGLRNAFVQENLTPKNRQIFYEARNLKRQGLLTSAWTDNCVVKVRKNENGQTFKIRDLSDLEKFRA